MADEPCLKYELLGGDCSSILASTSATALAVSDKLLALGTAAGSIHILDFEGNQVPVVYTHDIVRVPPCAQQNQVNRVDAHQAAITDLCLDGEAEWLASSAVNGTVHVHNLYGAADPITLQFDRQANVRTWGGMDANQRSWSTTLIDWHKL